MCLFTSKLSTAAKATAKRPFCLNIKPTKSHATSAVIRFPLRTNTRRRLPANVSSTNTVIQANTVALSATITIATIIMKPRRGSAEAYNLHHASILQSGNQDTIESTVKETRNIIMAILVTQVVMSEDRIQGWGEKEVKNLEDAGKVLCLIQR